MARRPAPRRCARLTLDLSAQQGARHDRPSAPTSRAGSRARGRAHLRRRSTVELMEHPKRMTADFIGVAVRAAHDTESTPSMLAAREGVGEADREGPARRSSRRAQVRATGRALADGAIGHSMDFDPMIRQRRSRRARPHSGPASGRRDDGRFGKSILTAIVAGSDVTYKLSQALKPADMYGAAFHPTVCPAASRHRRGRNVLRLVSAGDQASALRCRRLPGDAVPAQRHVDQALPGPQCGPQRPRCRDVRREQVTGAVDPIEGRFGLFHAYVPSADPDKAVANIRKVWEIETTDIKPYPTCRLSMRPPTSQPRSTTTRRPQRRHRRGDRGPGDTGLVITGRPEEQKREPRRGRWAIFHTLRRRVLRQGRLTWDDYGPRLADKRRWI